MRCHRCGRGDVTCVDVSDNEDDDGCAECITGRRAERNYRGACAQANRLERISGLPHVIVATGEYGYRVEAL